MNRKTTPTTTHAGPSIQQMFDERMSPERVTSLLFIVWVAHLPPGLLADMARLGPAREWLTTIACLLDVPVAPVGRWLCTRSRPRARRLCREDSAGVLALVRLIGRVQSIVCESGDPANFDAGRWTARFLTSPSPALSRLRPCEYLATSRGQELVSQLIELQQTGAYA